jgi:hypothetical protein
MLPLPTREGWTGQWRGSWPSPRNSLGTVWRRAKYVTLAKNQTPAIQLIAWFYTNCAMKLWAEWGWGYFWKNQHLMKKKERFTAIKTHHRYYTDSLVVGPFTHFADLFYSQWANSSLLLLSYSTTSPHKLHLNIKCCGFLKSYNTIKRTYLIKLPTLALNSALYQESTWVTSIISVALTTMSTLWLLSTSRCDTSWAWKTFLLIQLYNLIWNRQNKTL